MRVGAFLAAGGDVEPIGASSLFLSDFSAPKGAFSREGAFSSVGFFFLAFLGFLSSNLRTSSFSFCFADLRGANDLKVEKETTHFMVRCEGTAGRRERTTNF